MEISIFTAKTCPYGEKDRSCVFGPNFCCGHRISDKLIYKIRLNTLNVNRTVHLQANSPTDAWLFA